MLLQQNCFPPWQKKPTGCHLEGTFQCRASCTFHHSRTLKYYSASGQESRTAVPRQHVLPAPSGSMPETDYGCLSSQLLRCSYSLVTARALTVLHGWQLLLQHTAAGCESSWSSPYAREIRDSWHRRQTLWWSLVVSRPPQCCQVPCDVARISVPALSCASSNGIADLQPPFVVKWSNTKLQYNRWCYLSAQDPLSFGDKKQYLSDIIDSEMQGNDQVPRLWPHWIFRGWQLSSYNHGTYWWTSF